MATTKLYVALARLLEARRNCLSSGDDEWLARHTERIQALVREHMPSGAGFDCGTKVDIDESSADKLIFTTGFHHMDENGCYDGWTDHSIVVTPSLSLGFRLRVTGRDRNDIKDYIGEIFAECLDRDVE